MPQHDRPVPAAVFLPPRAAEVLDLSLWLPNDKHRVLEFTAPDLDRAHALAAAVSSW
jgi:hypothetical protein